MGIALATYHDVRGIYPTAYDHINHGPNKHNWNWTPTQAEIEAWSAPNWVILILPFMEEQNLYKQFNFKKTMKDASTSAAYPVSNAELANRDLEWMRCPSDSGIGNETRYSEKGKLISKGVFAYSKFARGNYAASGSTQLGFAYPPGVSKGAPDAGWLNSDYQWITDQAKYCRGIMGPGASLSRKRVTDGLTNTVLLAEIRIGLSVSDIRGTWAFGMPNCSTLWGLHYNLGPNSIYDGTGGGSAVYSELAGTAGKTTTQQQTIGEAIAVRAGHAFALPTYYSHNCGSVKSQHIAGANVCMADGSVRFLSNNVDVGRYGGYWFPSDGNYNTHVKHPPDPGASASLGLYERLFSSQDGMYTDTLAAFD